jgi:cell division protease FtsH
MVVMLFQMFKQPERAGAGLSYSEFLTMVERGNVVQVTIQGENISGLSNQGPFKTYAPRT